MPSQTLLRIGHACASLQILSRNIFKGANLSCFLFPGVFPCCLTNAFGIFFLADEKQTNNLVLRENYCNYACFYTKPNSTKPNQSKLNQARSTKQNQRKPIQTKQNKTRSTKPNQIKPNHTRSNQTKPNQIR